MEPAMFGPRYRAAKGKLPGQEKGFLLVRRNSVLEWKFFPLAGEGSEEWDGLEPAPKHRFRWRAGAPAIASISLRVSSLSRRLPPPAAKPKVEWVSALMNGCGTPLVRCTGGE